MITKPPSPPRVAIIRDFILESAWGQQMLDSFAKLVHIASPDAVIEYFQPIDGGALPEASSFDLIVLTGGTFDLTQPNHDPWVVKVLDLVRDTVANVPSTKLLGICWGHQAISYALGGEIVYRQGGPLIDVVDIPLNERGQEFFKGYRSLRLHKFHRRIVSSPAPGFQYLAEDLEISLSDSNQVLTFQGHPEMTAQIARAIVNNRDPAYLPDPSAEGVARLHEALARNEDGKEVFARVMLWAFDSALTST